MVERSAPAGINIELEGIGGSAGFAIGRASVVDPGNLGVTHRRISAGDVDAEMARFDAAVFTAATELTKVADDLRRDKPKSVAETSILDAYVLMVSDPTLRSDVELSVRDRHQCAEWALETAVEVMCSQLRQTDDAYLAERCHDFEFVRDRILRVLSGRSEDSIIPDSLEPVIIVARDLSPSQTATLSKDKVLGIVTAVGTRTSHTAILARALEIPAVVGVKGLLEHVGDGDILVLDGVHGKMVVSPSPEVLEILQPKAEKYYEAARDLRQHRDDPTQTSDGVGLVLQANIELAMEAKIALNQGAKGVGLYRTEFLYIDRKSPPPEEEQYEAYRSVLEVMSGLPVTLRTFDIGGDKFVSAIKMPRDMNPALGLRAVRLGLEQPELLKTQLRAMVRASAHGNVKIMVPMVASLSELRAVRALLSESVMEVDRAGHAHAELIELGCMIEVPSAAILAEEFAREAEFLSIGTNDLVQYTLAVDRTSRELARLASYFDPAVVRLIKAVVQAGNFRQKPVSVCGAMASDPLAAILLTGMGLRNLSMEASAIPEVRAALARVSLGEAQDAADTAFEATTAQELENGLHARFGERLRDIVDPS
jgi:phosphoenolpyruvate-protein phosphotransferase (PTS system enzyme I)